MFIDNFKKELSNFGLIIKDNNIDELLKLFNDNIYFEGINNKVSTREDVIDDIEFIPDFTDNLHKHYLSIYEGDILIGCIDIIEGYIYKSDQKNGLWIGLLEINNSFHNKHYGTKIVSSVKKAMKYDYDIIQIGVLKNNEIGLSFWKKNNFEIKADLPQLGLFLMEYKKS